jgi:hypothetical protein
MINELFNQNRTVTITIENKTKWTLKKSDQRLIQGLWILFPPETILPTQSVTFDIHSEGTIKQHKFLSLSHTLSHSLTEHTYLHQFF